MRSDIPRLMDERHLDAVVVTGNTDDCKDLAYVTGGVKLEGAMYLLRRDGAAALFASPLERELAASTGHPVRLWSDYDLNEYLLASQGDRLAAVTRQWTDILAELGITGRVGFFGAGASNRVPVGDIGSGFALLQRLASANPHLEVTGDLAPTLFQIARETKDDREIAAMRRAGELTGEVIAVVIAFIQSHAVRNGGVYKADGSPLTIGDCKALIRTELAKRNLDEAHENLFCQGRDGAVGHNTGQPDMPLRLGESIVFDLFPRDRASGYFHDITRTFFLGYAPPQLASRWRQVKTIFDLLLQALRVGEPVASYQGMTCDFFEDAGYPTLRSEPRTLKGYTHSLGHGVGLDVHEGPYLGIIPGNSASLQPGHVISIEPGLYDPDEGWAIRIEDTVAIDSAGQVVNLSASPYDMVIPMGV